MTLTEEQRTALKRVVAYMDEMYSVASPYHGCTEDANLLRAMIDSSEHVTDHTKMIGFDLEVRWHDDYKEYRPAKLYEHGRPRGGRGGA